MDINGESFCRWLLLNRLASGYYDVVESGIRREEEDVETEMLVLEAARFVGRVRKKVVHGQPLHAVDTRAVNCAQLSGRAIPDAVRVRRENMAGFRARRCPVRAIGRG